MGHVSFEAAPVRSRRWLVFDRGNASGQHPAVLGIGAVMSSTTAIDLLQGALSTALVLAIPVLVVLVAVALVINVLQTLTQLHDHTLTFVPKLIASTIVVLLLLPWLLTRLSDYAMDVYRTAALAR